MSVQKEWWGQIEMDEMSGKFEGGKILSPSFHFIFFVF